MGMDHEEDCSVFPLNPIFLTRPWGGSRLRQLYSKECPLDEHVGESWEVADRPSGQSMVSAGPLRGAMLGELWSKRRQIFGSRGLSSSAHRIPVLIKLVDASEFLSVQVHPSDAVCEMLGGEPKTETWLVLDATADAFAYVGLRAKVDRKEFADAVTAGEDISKFLVRVPVAVGDIIHIPAGQVHALGAGCLILEIQQNSETTYRIFDWNRHVEGKPRQLHIDEALASIDFGHGRSVLIDSSHKEVEHVTPWYIVRRLVLNGPRRLQDKDECAFVMPVNAPLVIAGYTIPQGSFALLSPAAPSASSLTAGTTVIAVGLGSSR